MQATIKKLSGAAILSAFLFLLWFGLAAADTFTLSGKVTDQSGNAISGATVAVIGPSSSSTVASGTTAADGTYAVSVPSGTYNVTGTPTVGSWFQQATIIGESITADTGINVALVPTTSNVMFSGVVRAADGTPVGGAQVMLNPASTTSGSAGGQAVSGGDGSFSIFVTPSSYTVSAELVGGPSTLPPTFVWSITVLDPQSNPISACSVTVISGAINFQLFPNGPATANSETVRSCSASGPTPVPLFPSSDAQVTVSPSQNGVYQAVTVSGQSVLQSTNTVLVLQFVHAPPVTTASTSPQVGSQGTYPGTVTVTLSASAASGFAVANTYYSPDAIVYAYHL